MDYKLDVVNIRLVKEPSLYSKEEVTTPESVVALMAKELAQYDREVMCVLNLKSNMQVINMNIVSMGTINSSLVSARELFKSSILSNAASMILLHNHPSGSITPSKQDQIVTKKLVSCGSLMDIPILDHIIVGGENGKLFSFKEQNLLETGALTFEPSEIKKPLEKKKCR
ncbi:MAG: JAB domain-containing protein [Lachnospiraceae bacterium]